METELDVYSAIVSKRATAGSEQMDPHQQLHSPDPGHAHATSSILCDLDIQSRC